MLAVRAAMTLLCAVGFYASVFMTRKSAAAAHGALREPSVVQTPRATLFGRIPNSVFGLVYYPVMAAVTWLGPHHLRAAAVAAAAAAAAMSAYLAYSLLFVTRRSCTYCWTSHACNWALLLLAAFFWS